MIVITQYNIYINNLKGVILYNDFFTFDRKVYFDDNTYVLLINMLKVRHLLITEYLT